MVVQYVWGWRASVKDSGLVRCRTIRLVGKVAC